VLTRDSDRFLPLRKRVATARKARADLFVSLHADSYKSPRVRGASVYALSLNGASSEAARLIAHKENASDLIGGISLDDKDDLIASVLLESEGRAPPEIIETSAQAGQGHIRRHQGACEETAHRLNAPPPARPRPW